MLVTSIFSSPENELKHLFALEFGKIADYDCLSLSSTNINQPAPNLVQMYMTINEFDYGTNRTRTV